MWILLIFAAEISLLYYIIRRKAISTSKSFNTRSHAQDLRDKTDHRTIAVDQEDQLVNSLNSAFHQALPEMFKYADAQGQDMLVNVMFAQVYCQLMNTDYLWDLIRLRMSMLLVKLLGHTAQLDHLELPYHPPFFKHVATQLTKDPDFVVFRVQGIYADGAGDEDIVKLRFSFDKFGYKCTTTLEFRNLDYDMYIRYVKPPYKLVSLSLLSQPKFDCEVDVVIQHSEKNYTLHPLFIRVIKEYLIPFAIRMLFIKPRARIFRMGKETMTLDEQLEVQSLIAQEFHEDESVSEEPIDFKLQQQKSVQQSTQQAITSNAKQLGSKFMEKFSTATSSLKEQYTQQHQQSGSSSVALLKTFQNFRKRGADAPKVSSPPMLPMDNPPVPLAPITPIDQPQVAQPSLDHLKTEDFDNKSSSSSLEELDSIFAQGAKSAQQGEDVKE